MARADRCAQLRGRRRARRRPAPGPTWDPNRGGPIRSRMEFKNNNNNNKKINTHVFGPVFKAKRSELLGVTLTSMTSLQPTNFSTLPLVCTDPAHRFPRAAFPQFFFVFFFIFSTSLFLFVLEIMAHPFVEESRGTRRRATGVHRCSGHLAFECRLQN